MKVKLIFTECLKNSSSRTCFIKSEALTQKLSPINLLMCQQQLNLTDVKN